MTYDKDRLYGRAKTLMPYTIQVEERLVRIQMAGRLTLPELTRLAQYFGELESRSAVSPHRLLDLSKVDGVDMNFADMEDLAAQRRAAPLKNLVKSAILAPKPVLFGFARMFQTLNSHPQIQVEIFTELNSALQWLETSP